VPTDLSKYVQIEVTSAKLRSEEAGLTDAYGDGEKLYHHFLELYNGDTVIARVRIEGYEGTGPLAANTAEGISYVAASTASFAVNGDRRMRPIDFDAGGLRSTGRHVMAKEKLEEIVGPPPSNSNGQRAYFETFGAFTESVHTTQYHDGNGWQNKVHDFSDGYGLYKDRYMSPDLQPDENDTLMEFRTGIFIDGLRGNIKGTSYNDVIHTIGVNEKTPYVEDKSPDNVQAILKGDAFYSNIINAQGGNDIVVAGQGDNYILDATLVKINAKPGDDNFITTPGIVSYGTGKFQSRSRNPKAYVNVQGGNETYIYAPDEFDYSKYESADAGEEGTEGVEKWDESFVDDYFDINSSSVGFSNPIREGEGTGGAAQQSDMLMDKVGIYDAATEAEDLFWDELTALPDVDEAQLEATWDDVMGQNTAMSDEMNGFFDEMFGEMEGTFSEYNEDMGYMGYDEEIL